MCGREGVVDPDVSEFCQFRDEGGIVLLLFLVEAGVFQAKDVAILHRGDRSCRGLTDAILGKGDRFPDHQCQSRRDRLQRVLGVATLGPAEMREQDDLAALDGDLVDGGRDALQPGGVGDVAVFHGNVEVDAQQHALALHVDVIEGAESVHAKFSSVMAGPVPAIHVLMRQRKTWMPGTRPGMTIN